MKNEAIFFTKEAIIKFLGDYGRPNTKDYEFVAALIIHHFCEKKWGEKCWVGFRIKQKYSNLLPAVGSKKEIGLSEIAGLLRGGIDEDSLVDFVVAKEADIRKAQGMIFQVKRFGIGRMKKDTDELIAYLNSFLLPKTYIDLLVYLDDGVNNIDMEKLCAGINISNFPFNRIMFTWISNNTVYLKDVYPLGGMEAYPISEIY